MKKLNYLVVILLIVISMSACNTKIVAKVNDTQISKDEYKKIETLLKTIGQYNKDSNSSSIDNTVLSFIIDNEIVYQVAKEKGYKVSKDEINNKYDQLESTIYNNENKVKFKDAGIDEEFFKGQIEKDLVVNKYKEDFLEDIIISDEEMNAYYDDNKENLQSNQVRASQILISTLDNDGNEVSEEEKVKLKEKADGILEEIKNNNNKFEELASSESDDKKSGKKGGDLGYFTKDDKSYQFTSVVFNLNKNDISEVFETSYGYHIVKITDKKAVYRTFDECKNEIKEKLLNNKYIEHIDSLYDKAKITIT